jgi:hypothetical protein
MGVPVLLLGCSEASPADGGSAGALTAPMAMADEAISPGDGSGVPEPPSGGELAGGPDHPLRVLDLSTLPSRTTPDAISIALAQNIDQLKLQLNLNDARGFPVSGCQTLDIYRIGPNAVRWAIGATLTLPLGYPEALPHGLYTQTVYMLLGAGDYDVPYDMRTAHYFEVDADGLRPMTSTEYSDAVTPTTIGPNGEVDIVAAPALPEGQRPRDPCPPPAILTDVMTAEGATSRVDFDAWSGVDTIQPFRWRPSMQLDDGSRTEPRLLFHARDAAAGRIRFDVLAPSEVPESDFEAEVGGAARIIIDDPGEVDFRGRPSSAGTSWSGQSGRVAVHIEPGGTLRIELTDVVLTQSRMVTEPEVNRTVTSGSIRGAWLLE